MSSALRVFLVLCLVYDVISFDPVFNNESNTFIALGSLSECIQRRYYHVNEPKTWADAQSYCRHRYTDLATVDSMDDMNDLMKTVNNNVNVWIGLKNTGVYRWKGSVGDPVNNQTSNIAGLFNDSWEWSDTSDSAFRYWNSGEPNDNSPSFCTEAIINKAGKWNDLGCSYTRIFVCHKGNSSLHVFHSIKIYRIFLHVCFGCFHAQHQMVVCFVCR